MSNFSLNQAGGPVDSVVGPRIRPLGGFEVNRVWPTARRRLVGPFIFFDHLLRTELPAGVGLDVPPHPHIGLATVTYLFEGEIMHADSLGGRQPIRPGEINWMTAGRGITHAERSTVESRAAGSVLHGIQTWVALPIADELCDPGFAHYARSALPVVELPRATARVLAGAAFGARSGVEPGFDLFYVEVDADADAALRLDSALGQRAIYVVSGGIQIGNARYEPGRALVLADGEDIEIRVTATSKLMLFGGQPIDGDRFVYWNFVSSDAERIEQAKADWQAQRFPPVPGDPEFMPLPG